MEELGNVAAGFSGRTEEGWAGGPSHLERCRDHDHDVIVRVGWVRGEDMAELVLVGFGHHHAPETVLDVELAEEDGAVGLWEGGDHVDEAAEDVAELVHGVGGGSVVVGEFIDGFGVGFALTFFGKVEDHAEEAALVGDGGNGADLGVAAEASNDEGSEVFPRDEFDEVLCHFF